jgi:hypothetical protein
MLQRNAPFKRHRPSEALDQPYVQEMSLELARGGRELRRKKPRQDGNNFRLENLPCVSRLNQGILAPWPEVWILGLEVLCFGGVGFAVRDDVWVDTWIGRFC